MKHEGTIEYICGIILGIGHLATKDNILFLLSCACTLLAIWKYILDIKEKKSRIK